MKNFPDGKLFVVSGVQLPKKVAGADPPWAYPLSKIKQEAPSEEDIRRMLGWFEGQECVMVRLLRPQLIMPQFHCSLNDIRPKFEDETVEMLCRFIGSGVCSLVGSPPPRSTCDLVVLQNLGEITFTQHQLQMILDACWESRVVQAYFDSSLAQVEVTVLGPISTHKTFKKVLNDIMRANRLAFKDDLLVSVVIIKHYLCTARV